MAIIQRIRTRAGLLLAIVVGVALFAFILGDFITSGGFLYRKSKMNIAEINGTKIPYPEYQQVNAYVEEIMKAQYQTTTLDENLIENIRNQAWQELIQKYLLDKEYHKLGLFVSDQEFNDLIQGRNPHPLVMQMFANPETGTLNRLQLSEFLSRIDEITGAPKEIWVFYERVINKERLFAKYTNLIRKGFYVNKLEVERRQKDMNTTVDFSYIMRKYSELSDSTLIIHDSEIKKFYTDYKERYKQEESRDLKYVAFEVIPSPDDFNDAEAWINDIRTEFEEVEDVEQYINFTSPPYDPTNYKKDELPDTMAEFMFSSELGAVYGPWFEDNSYKLAKLAKISLLSDSVRASHILIPVTQANVEQMRQLADSLKTLAESGYNFSTLVESNSSDVATVMSGGDLGWFKEGMKGRYFSDTCFFANLGDVKITYSEEGFHVVKITDKSKPVKKVQIGILSREVTPSAVTDQYYYSKAVEFASANNTLQKFEEAVADNDPVAIPVFGLQPLDNNIQGLQNSRAIVHWAFEEAEEGELQRDIQDYSGKYIVAVVTKVYNKGYRTLDDVTDDIRFELFREKKAELLSEEMKQSIANVNSIDEAARLMQLQVNSATGIRFTSFSIQGVGTEPRLIAAVTNAVSEGICGMDLIPLVQNEINVDPDAVELSEAAVALANVQTTLVKRQIPERETRLYGKIKPDERLLKTQAAHVPGRIEKLIVNFTGETVQEGQIIALIYSPQLITAQKELLEALKLKNSYPELLTAAREKLRLWKLTDEQINEIEYSGNIRTNFEIIANMSGIVISRKVNVGDYVSQGAILYEIADLSTVWALFDAYESDLPWIKKGEKIKFTARAMPEKTFSGIISFIAPVVDPLTRVTQVRVEVNNSDGQLKPDMFVTGYTESHIGNNMQQLIIPGSAVLWTGTRSVVYVKLTGSPTPAFVMRQIEMGPSLGDSYIVLSGLEEGEEIVTNGTFSVDAAAQLAGKPSMMNKEGGKVITGHNHGSMDMKSEQGSMEDHSALKDMDMAKKEPEINSKFKKQLNEVYNAYLEMKNAFVASNAKQAGQKADLVKNRLKAVNMGLLEDKEHMEWMQYLEQLNNALVKITSASDIGIQRKAFAEYNLAFYKNIKHFGLSEGTVYYQYCPMADGEKGAYWFSNKKEIENPYFGDAMLKCGETREIFNY